MIAGRVGAPLLFCSLLSSACPFDGGVPDGAVLLCVGNGACPPEWTCDTAVHECREPGATSDTAAPVLVGAAFEPAVVADGPVELIITADEALGAAPLLRFEGSGDPGFVLVDLTGPNARFALDASTVAAGAWPLGSAELVDGSDNRAERLTPNTTLVIDRRLPAILGLAVSHADPAAAGLPFSANAGTNQLAIAFVLDEVVAQQDLAVAAGPATASCTLGVANAFACTAQVTSAFTDGRDRVVVAVADRAGNRADASVDIDTDLRAPAVVDVVTVLHSPASNAPVGAAVAGGSINVELILDEPLGAPPDFTLTGDVAIADVRVEELTPLRWRWSATVLLIGTAGVAQLGAELHDRVGNVANIEVDAVPLALAVLSPCAPLDPSVDCVDFDGDGDFAITAACGIRGGDCDDTDPLSRSDGVEIPGDGADNDCAGDGDMPIDEGAGVFVDPAATIGGVGTRASPVRTIAEAMLLLAGRGWLFLAYAGGVGQWAADYDLGVSVVGALDGEWRRIPGARSSVAVRGFVPPATGAEVVVLDGVALSNANAPSPIYSGVRLTLVRSESPGDLIATARLVAVDSALHPLEIAADVAGSLVARSSIHEIITIGVNSELLIVGSDGEDFLSGGSGPDIIANAGARLDVVNSLVPPIACNGCTLRLTHSVITTDEPDIAALVTVTGSPAPVDLRNNIFYWLAAAPGSAVVSNDNQRLRSLGNLFYAPFPGARLVVDGAFITENVAVLNDCAPLNCTESFGNLVGDPRFSAEPGHIEQSSPALAAAAANYTGLPHALAADIDGDCRTPVAPDIGADEK